MKSSPGFGKTLAAASFALAGPTYIAYFDKSKPIELLTYFTEKRFGSKAKTILNNITYDIYGASNANDYLNKLIEFATKRCPYSTIITDSVTTMTSSVTNWSLGWSPKSKGSIINPDDDRVVPDWDEYKVLTSFVSQALDLHKLLPANTIWTAHPLPSVKLEGSGNSIRVTKTNPIVAYGGKVAGMIPGSFTEIYHFSQQQDWNQSKGENTKKYICNLDSIGDEFAKSPLLGHRFKELDVTNRIFYEVWKDACDIAAKDLKNGDEPKDGGGLDNPFNPNKPKW